jgi:hypothetical protein
MAEAHSAAPLHCLNTRSVRLPPEEKRTLPNVVAAGMHGCDSRCNHDPQLCAYF